MGPMGLAGSEKMSWYLALDPIHRGVVQNRRNRVGLITGDVPDLAQHAAGRSNLGDEAGGGVSSVMLKVTAGRIRHGGIPLLGCRGQQGRSRTTRCLPSYVKELDRC